MRFLKKQQQLHTKKAKEKEEGRLEVGKKGEDGDVCGGRVKGSVH